VRRRRAAQKRSRDAGTGALGGPAPLGVAADEGVLRGSSARPAHAVVLPRGHPLRGVLRKAEGDQPRGLVGGAATQHLRDRPLAGARLLPDLRQVVPDVVLVEDADRVADQRPGSGRPAGARGPTRPGRPGPASATLVLCAPHARRARASAGLQLPPAAGTDRPAGRRPVRPREDPGVRSSPTTETVPTERARIAVAVAFVVNGSPSPRGSPGSRPPVTRSACPPRGSDSCCCAWPSAPWSRCR
jgi:hypothetical protein